MNIKGYISRIKYEGELIARLDYLKRLHNCHVMAIAFEALDVQMGKKIELMLENIFHKIIISQRGGYCYELNYLFHSLLNKIGFFNRMISVRIFEDGKYGPEYDHLAIIVELDELWLVDVGFGDLFVEPIKIAPDQIQKDLFKCYMN